MPPELGSKHLSPGKQCGRGFSLGSQRQGHWADETRSNSEEPQRADGKGVRYGWAGVHDTGGDGRDGMRLHHEMNWGGGGGVWWRESKNGREGVAGRGGGSARQAEPLNISTSLF